MTSPNPYAVDVDTLTGMKPISKVVFALGSNLGDEVANLSGGVIGLRATPDLIVVDVSPIYQTAPVGAPDGSPDFLNCVVVAETTLPPRTLLERAQAIEEAFDRTRSGEPNEPRTLDVDVIMVGRQTMDTPELVLPHPRAQERAFVLAPWLDIDPDGELPGHGRIDALLASVGTAGVRRRDDLALEES